MHTTSEILNSKFSHDRFFPLPDKFLVYIHVYVITLLRVLHQIYNHRLRRCGRYQVLYLIHKSCGYFEVLPYWDIYI